MIGADEDSTRAHDNLLQWESYLKMCQYLNQRTIFAMCRTKFQFLFPRRQFFITWEYLGSFPVSAAGLVSLPSSTRSYNSSSSE